MWAPISKAPTLALFIALVFLQAPAAKRAAVLCVGDKAAKTRVVYFHGMDEGEPGEHEKKNREILTRIAKDLGTVVAIPRGNGLCSGKRCWRQNSKNETAATYRAALTEAQECFARTDGDVITIGFSNGGYLLSKVLHHCLTPKPLATLAIASAGTVPPQVKSLKDCGRHTQLIGKKDLSLAKAKAYDAALVKVGAATELIEFAGGHVIPEKEVREWLKRML